LLINTEFHKLKLEGKNWTNRTKSKKKGGVSVSQSPLQSNFAPERLSKQPPAMVIKESCYNVLIKYIYNLKIITTDKGMGRLFFYYILYLICELLLGRNPKKL
jgi:hypothetical protein